MMYAIEHFNQYAVKENLSAGAILLWHQLFFTMQRKNQFADVQQHTAVLTAMLDVTRQGLQAMRQTLIDKGLLAIRQDEHQQIFYTLLLNGRVVGEKAALVEVTADNGQSDRSLRHASRDTSPEGRGYDKPVCCISKLSPRESWQAEGLTERASGDIILTNRIRPYIEQFCEKFGPAMKGDLIQWAEMRRKNGWTLTLWGLEALFKNLIELSAGNGAQMSQIVAQSVKRRWKGFFALKVKPKPSGAKLLEEEAAQNGTPSEGSGYNRRYNPKPVHKFKPEGRDLSFLER